MDRTDKITKVKVYSNLDKVVLYVNGKKFSEQCGHKVFTFCVPLEGDIILKAVAGTCEDEAVIRKVRKPNPAYKLKKNDGKGENWT